MKTVALSTRLQASADRIWQEVNTPRLLMHVASPVLSFELVEPSILPEKWEERDYRFRLKFYGVLPVGEQTVRISRPQPDGSKRYVRDNGFSALIRRWDHLITIEPDGDGTLYSDRIEIEAGVLTPFVAAFARRFYAHRQRRWQHLVAADFEYPAA